MLVLSRKIGERIVIDGRITVVVNRVAGNRVTLGIEAPQNVKIVRGELEPLFSEFHEDESARQHAAVSPGVTFELPLDDFLPRASR